MVDKGSILDFVRTCQHRVHLQQIRVLAGQAVHTVEVAAYHSQASDFRSSQTGEVASRLASDFSCHTSHGLSDHPSNTRSESYFVGAGDATGC